MSEAEEKLKLLAALARRCEKDADFMAYALAQFRRQRGLTREDEAALTRELGATPEALARLALCRRPDAGAANDEADTARQVGEIAAYSGVPAERVAALLRAVEAEGEAPTPDAVAVQSARVRRAWRRFAALFHHPAGVAPHPAWLWAATACLLFFAVGGLLWVRRRGPEMTEHAYVQPSSSAAPAPSLVASATPSVVPAAPLPSASLPSPPQVSPPAEAEPVTVAVNLARYTALRGAQAGDGARAKAIRLRARLTHLTLTLPPDSSPGRYRVAVVNAGLQPLVSAPAVSNNGQSLQVTLELGRLRRGSYILLVEPSVEAPFYYTINIVN